MPADAVRLQLHIRSRSPAAVRLARCAAARGHLLRGPWRAADPRALVVVDWDEPIETGDARVLAIVGDADQAAAALAAGVEDLFGPDASPAEVELRLRAAERRVANAVRIRALETQLDHAEAMASVGARADGIAHEVKTPLGYIAMNLDFVRRVLDVEAHPDASDALADAREGVDRIRELLDALCDPDADAGRLDVRRVLDSALRLTGEQLRRRARIERRFGEVPRVRASAARLWQVFVNLLVNALHALPDDGADENFVRVETATDAHGDAVVCVVDSGPGMPEEVAARAFDPFFTTRAGEGSGLGLAICLEIISRLGGSIDVRSAPGEGTRVRIRLPAAQATVPLRIRG